MSVHLEASVGLDVEAEHRVGVGVCRLRLCEQQEVIEEEAHELFTALALGRETTEPLTVLSCRKSLKRKPTSCLPLLHWVEKRQNH